MAEWNSVGDQTVNPGESIVFTLNPVPCTKGLVNQLSGTGAFNLKGSVKYYRDLCRCQQPKAAQYFTNFSANIGIPTGGTEQDQISVAFALDGVTIPGTTMQAPGAVGTLYNISTATNIPVLKSCCQTVTVRNTSAVPITVNNPNIVFFRRDLV